MIDILWSDTLEWHCQFHVTLHFEKVNLFIIEKYIFRADNKNVDDLNRIVFGNGRLSRKIENIPQTQVRDGFEPISNILCSALSERQLYTGSSGFTV